ncbi:9078_t:CDS:1 [Racocetra fulgida]|uniref:9078_t:CDS:1 n=1 Tax=Racocetra fulgida TaxID=60492 RepID=A0A9N9GBA7_9GLOM|nr:9078_t:CDS:1 [Racocetra fulgida]
MTLENDKTFPRMFYEGESKFLEFKIHDVTFCCNLPTPNELTFKSEGCKKLNDFTIFRKVLQQHLQNKSDNLKIARIQNVDISSLSGEIWNNSSEAFKNMFKLYAKEVNDNRVRQKKLSFIVNTDPTGKKKRPRKTNKNKERKNNHSKQIIDKMRPNVASSIIDGSSFNNDPIVIRGNNDVKEIPHVVKPPTHLNMVSPVTYMQPQLSSTSLQTWNNLFEDGINVMPDFIDGINFQQLHTDHLTPISLNNTHTYIPSLSCQTTIGNLTIKDNYGAGISVSMDENNVSGIIEGINFNSNNPSLCDNIDGAKLLSTNVVTNEMDILGVNSMIHQQINPMGYMHPSISPDDICAYIQELDSSHVPSIESDLISMLLDNR